MELLTIVETTELLGIEDLGPNLVLRGLERLTSATFYLPLNTVDQTILARILGTIIASEGPSFLQVTYWTDDQDSNQNLFYGYRKGLGDERSLAEASVHKFDKGECSTLASVLSLVIYFGWDARMFNAKLSYQLRVNNDGFLDFDATSDDQPNIERALSLLRPLEPAA